MKDKEKNLKSREDTSKYGEFVSSFFSWITLERQKKRAKELENMTKKEK